MKKSEKRRNNSMLSSTIIMGVLAVILLLIGYYRGQGQHWTGLRSALVMTVEIAPLLVFAFVISGMVQVLISEEAISRWVGRESGMKGIMIGAVAGGLAPGGPYVSLPIVAALLRSGASIGTAVAFLTGWLLWAATRLPMEIGILGLRFTLIRLACTFFFPPIAGLVAQAFFGGGK